MVVVLPLPVVPTTTIHESARKAGWVKVSSGPPGSPGLSGVSGPGNTRCGGSEAVVGSEVWAGGRFEQSCTLYLISISAIFFNLD